MAVSDAVTRLKADLAAISGIARVGGVPDIAHDLPYVAVYLGRAEWRPNAGNNEALCLGEFFIDLHAMAIENGFVRAEAAVQAFYESIPLAVLKDITLNGKVQGVALEEAITYDGLQQFTYGGATTLGARWRVPFKYTVNVA